MILDAIIVALESRFPDRHMRVEGERPEAAGGRAIVFPAAHAAVGDVVIWEEGSEATLGIGDISTGHFGSEAATLAPHDAAVRIAADVADFLEDLFADRVLLWTALGGMAGGWRHEATAPTKAPRSTFRDWFVWSGPLPK